MDIDVERVLNAVSERLRRTKVFLGNRLERALVPELGTHKCVL